MMITPNMWPLDCQQGFPLIWPGDLVSDIKWPSFKLDLEIKMNTLSNIYDEYSKNVTSGVLTRFFFDLAWRPSFWPQVTQFQIWPRNQYKHFGQNSWWLLQKCYLKSVYRVLGLAWWPSFWPQMTQFQTWSINHSDKHFEQDSWWLLQ